jgi:hypothetical protein
LKENISEKCIRKKKCKLNAKQFMNIKNFNDKNITKQEELIEELSG